MPTFIDESGDTGHGRGSKNYFRLAAVWMPSADCAEDFREAVRQLRRELGRKPSYEFKFVKTHTYPEGRRRFFQTALRFPFRFAVCALDKIGHWLNAPSQEQHWATAVSLAVMLRTVYLEAEKADTPFRDPVLVDRNDDMGFLDEIRKAFQGLRSYHHPGIPLTDVPRFRKSHSDEVLQLVDMVCGAVGASVDGDWEWRKMIEGKSLGIIHLP